MQNTILYNLSQILNKLLWGKIIISNVYYYYTLNDKEIGSCREIGQPLLFSSTASCRKEAVRVFQSIFAALRLKLDSYF